MLFFVEFEFETKETKNKQAVNSFLINFDCSKIKSFVVSNTTFIFYEIFRHEAFQNEKTINIIK